MHKIIARKRRAGKLLKGPCDIVTKLYFAYAVIVASTSVGALLGQSLCEILRLLLIGDRQLEDDRGLDELKYRWSG